MANAIIKPGANALSVDIANSLVSGIIDLQTSTPLVGGKPIVRLMRNGIWVYGQENIDVEEGSEWCINPLSIKHGYVCWSDYPGTTKNERLGEVMAPISERKPAMPEPVQGFPFKEQRVFEMMCVSGEDEGIEVIYMGSSVGALRAVDNFFSALVKQLKTDPTHPVAVVQLTSTSYNHPKYNEIFNPIFEIVDWADMGGNRANGAPAIETAEEEVDTTPPAEPAKRGRAVKQPAAAAAAQPAPRASAAPVRRQRPVGRG